MKAWGLEDDVSKGKSFLGVYPLCSQVYITYNPQSKENI